jgi:hypothetical protein
MLKPPRCKLCQKGHWGSCPEIEVKEEPKVDGWPSQTKWRKNNPQKYREYMREYMRSRRGKKDE